MKEVFGDYTDSNDWFNDWLVSNVNTSTQNTVNVCQLRGGNQLRQLRMAEDSKGATIINEHVSKTSKRSWHVQSQLWRGALAKYMRFACTLYCSQIDFSHISSLMYINIIGPPLTILCSWDVNYCCLNLLVGVMWLLQLNWEFFQGFQIEIIHMKIVT